MTAKSIIGVAQFFSKKENGRLAKAVVIIVVGVALVGVAYWFYPRGESQEQWLQTAITVAAKLETKTSGKFIRENKIEITEKMFEKFNPKILYVNFRKGPTAEAAYHEGVLTVAPNVPLNDTSKALLLMYGIAYHTITAQNQDYGDIPKKLIENVRAQQYVMDVLFKIGGDRYRKLLLEEQGRQKDGLRKYNAMEFPHYKNELEAIFGAAKSEDEEVMKYFNLQIGASFKKCDELKGVESWLCKIDAYNAIISQIHTTS